MIRRDFMKGLPLLAGAGIGITNGIQASPLDASVSDRDLWLDTLLKVASPVLTALSENRLKDRMPVESSPESQNRRKVTYLEALGRTMAGLAPWLELAETSDNEGELRK